MRKFSAHYLITGNGDILKRPVIITTNEGTIVSITDTGGDLQESAGLAFYNGIMIPGLVNAHCHLELSHFRNRITPLTGLPQFITEIRRLREEQAGQPSEEAKKHDKLMSSEGVVACADISNGTDSFRAKTASTINYTTLIEVFGINPASAEHRFAEALEVSAEAARLNLRSYIVPHSLYALSLPLLRRVKEHADCSANQLTSIHFMESPDERLLVEKREGALLSNYHEFGIDQTNLETTGTHSQGIMEHVTRNGNLILVHNTFADELTIDSVSSRSNLYWCLCPSSNIYIGGTMPPVELLRQKQCTIVIGTDSLASNSRLSMIAEMLLLQEHFPSVTLGELVIWATANGAQALDQEKMLGTIEPGKRPGLVLLENCDLRTMKLTTNTKARRLI